MTERSTLSHWKSLPLNQFVSLQRGHDLTWRQRRQGNVPVIGSAGANGTHDRALAIGPGVVLGRSGASFGQAHYVDSDYWPHNTALYVTDFHGNDPRFTYYLLTYIDFTSFNSGGAQQSLNRNFIASILVDVPELTEQIQIVAALDDASKQIETLERLIAKKQAIKQGMMQRLLGLTAARDWTQLRMQELVAAMFSGPSPTCEERTIRGNEWGVLKTTCATWECGWNPAMHKVLPREFWGRTSIEVHAGDSIVTKAGPRHRVGVPAYVSAIQPHIVPSGKMICVRPNQARILPGFLALALADRRTQAFLDQRTTGMAESQVNFENGDLRAAPLWLPSRESQRHILETLTDVDTQIAVLNARHTKARAIKTGMLQQLLTGRTRLALEEVSA